MRKRIITSAQPPTAGAEQAWLDLDALAEVEITSEDAAHPIEAAVLLGQEGAGLSGSGIGWRAAGPGEQTIRIVFLAPQRVRHIRLQFSERVAARTQDYVLRWSSDDGRTFHEIVRQQWNFSPDGATVELEEHHVDLLAVTHIELIVTPDISNLQENAAIASLDFLRLA